MLSSIVFDDIWGFVGIILALFLGGILKGATGAGMPVIAVPVIAAFYDVRTAVLVLVIPNLLVNLWQIYKFRNSNSEPILVRNFALSGAIGAGIGTLMLARLSADFLSTFIALIIFVYIALRFFKPAFGVPVERARPMAWLAGAGGGILQGSIGLSAPIAVTFANAIKMERPVFIFTVSVFFATMCLVQFPMQLALGMMTWQIVILGFISLVPMMIGLQAGDWVGKRMGAVVFDRVILFMLAVLAIKQLF